MNENPGAYHEARNRLREEKEQEKKKLEDLTEKFEKQREYTRTVKKFDIFELRHRIETGRSLLSLQSEISEALKEGQISRETFDSLQSELDSVLRPLEKSEKILSEPLISAHDLPFGKTEIAQFFENQKMGENIFVDIGAFMYGFFVQGSAILVILLWKILLDIIFFPRDIFQEFKK